MTQDRRITDKLPGHPLQWDDSASPSAAPAAGQAGLATDYVLMPKRLTAENGAKAALLGEFKETYMVECHECEGSGEDQHGYECAECKGDGEVQAAISVGWDTIKDIYARAVELLAAPVLTSPSSSDDGSYT